MTLNAVNMDPLVLIVEDSRAQMELLRCTLEIGGYRTAVAADGEEALLCAEEEEPDLVILDWMLPHISGFEVCHRLRQQKSTRRLPILMVLARREDSDVVRGLDAGAHDYLVKPFSPGVMMARIRAILRRANPALGEGTLKYGGVTIDMRELRVYRNGREVHLSPAEFRFLRTLLEWPGHVYARDTLLRRVKGEDSDCEPRNIDMLVSRVRKALTAAGETDVIHTVRGVGYAIESETHTMDETLKHIILRALQDTKAADLTAAKHDAMAIEAVIRDRPDLSPVEVMVLINQVRQS